MLVRAVITEAYRAVSRGRGPCRPFCAVTGRTGHNERPIINNFFPPPFPRQPPAATPPPFPSRFAPRPRRAAPRPLSLNDEGKEGKCSQPARQAGGQAGREAEFHSARDAAPTAALESVPARAAVSLLPSEVAIIEAAVIKRRRMQIRLALF